MNEEFEDYQEEKDEGEFERSKESDHPLLNNLLLFGTLWKLPIP